MCLRNLILHKNIKCFHCASVRDGEKHICTTYIFPFKKPHSHSTTCPLKCHDNMPVRPSSRWWRLSLSGKWRGWRSRWLSDGVFPPVSRPPIQVPEAPLVRSLPPSSSPFHTASRGQTRAWTGTGRWTPRMKNLEKREGEAQLSCREDRAGKPWEAAWGKRVTSPVMVRLSVHILLLQSCDHFHLLRLTLHLFWGIETVLHWKDLLFGHRWLVVQCEPGEATNLRIKKRRRWQQVSQVRPVTQVPKNIRLLHHPHIQLLVSLHIGRHLCVYIPSFCSDSMHGDFVVQGMSHEMATQLTFEYRLQLRQGTMCCPEGPNLLQRVTIGRAKGPSTKRVSHYDHAMK